MPSPNDNTPAGGTQDLATLEAALQAEADARARGFAVDDEGADDSNGNGNGNGTQSPPDDGGEEIPQSQLQAEATARRKGWLPKDQYKGDPKTWVDAETFLDRGEKFNANLQRELASVKERLGKQSETFQKLAKFYQETLAQKESELQSAIAQLRVQRSQAQADGDHETAIQLEDRIDLLKEAQSKVKDERKAAVEEQKTPVAEPPPAEDPMQNPVLQEWIADGNEWFRDNPRLRAYSLKLGEQLVAAGATARGRKFLDLVSEKMREEFPRTFREATGGSSNALQLESTNSAAARGGQHAAKTERDLPEEDRRLMNQYVKEGWMTKEAFLKSYFSR